jgi:hypothetical protein
MLAKRVLDKRIESYRRVWHRSCREMERNNRPKLKTTARYEN